MVWVMCNNQLKPVQMSCDNSTVSNDYLIHVTGDQRDKGIDEPITFPASFALERYDFDSPIHGYRIRVDVESPAGILEISRLEIQRTYDEPAISAATLREVSPSEILAAIQTFVVNPSAADRLLTASHHDEPAPDTWGSGHTVQLFQDLDTLSTLTLPELRALDGFPPLHEVGGTFVLDSDDYTADLRDKGPSNTDVQIAVKWLYLFAQSRKIAPTRFISEALGIPQSTASHWVKLTREGGQLPPATRRTRSDRRG